MKSKFIFDSSFKLIVIISAAILYASTMNSQGSSSFPFDNSTWRYGVYDVNNCSGVGAYCGYVTYEFRGDTLLPNYTYHKLFATDPQNTVFNYVAAIRQDSLTGDLFILYSSGQCNSSDTLLYSFHWSASDTLRQCDRVLGQLYSNILNIDSIFLLGEWKTRINLQSQFNTQLIEDVGSTTGLIGPWEGWIDGNMTLECFQVNGVAIYPSSSCGLNDINNIRGNKEDYIIYPSYANNEIFIKANNGFHKYVVRFINTDAQIIKWVSFDLDSNDQYKISTMDILNGIYIVQVSTGTTNIFSKPIIISH